MKKVRYLAGAVGAVPVLGMMMPATAAVAAVHPPGAKAKTVSLAHGAAARTPGGLAVNQASSCTGTTVVHEVYQGTKHFKPSLSTTFWYKKAAGGSGYCIGTVEGRWNDGGGFGASIDFRVRIYSGSGTRKALAYSKKVHPNSTGNSHTFTAAIGAHRWNGFSRGLPVQICTAWVISQLLLAGPQCRTFG